jgi:hypothetical protein
MIEIIFICSSAKNRTAKFALPGFASPRRWSCGSTQHDTFIRATNSYDSLGAHEARLCRAKEGLNKSTNHAAAR